MTTPASNNRFKGVTFQDQATPTTPAAGDGRLFLDTADGLLKWIDDAGVVTAVALGGAGDVATDAIWDAKGDLAAGTGANAASKLTVGANDTILMADSAQSTGLKWAASQTPSTQAFGDSAAEGTADTYARGDHKHAMPANPVGSTGARYPVQSISIASASGTTRAPVFASTPTNGNIIYAMCLTEGTDAVTSIVQTNVTWTKLTDASAGVAPVIELWKGVVSASAGTTATVTWGATTFHCVVMMEWSGTAGTLSTSATRHVTTDSASAGAAHPIPILTPTNPTDLVIAACSTASNGTTFSTFTGTFLVAIETGRTIGVAWGFPGISPVYGALSGGASATATGLTASIA